MFMKNIILLIFNSLTFVLTLYLNYLFGAGVGDRKSVGEISSQFDTLITPAGYAFSIWGLIYLMLFGFLVYQWITYFRNNSHKSLAPSSFWFGLSNLLNALWIVVWTSELIGLSSLVIFGLLASLLVLVFRLKLEIWDAPLSIIAFVWWPICIYTGWIVVASVVNLSVWFYTLNIFQNEPLWTIIVLMVATGIYLFLTFKRNMREAAVVGVWAFVAISVKQWDVNQEVAYTALLLVGLLTIAVSYHAFVNRSTNPITKIFQRS
ncbi:hypothetical protein CLW00_1086 [Mongoliibacter ruber]|uniref:TspO/MBR related protein n=2 Tax=Mongoliibacter ruber TaxID=1750599 RepID=A0A2T0WIJ2_9BACT|nr:hypothetical protein CLW00_1086 [Mongoliibacter ruber]